MNCKLRIVERRSANHDEAMEKCAPPEDLRGVAAPPYPPKQTPTRNCTAARSHRRPAPRVHIRRRRFAARALACGATGGPAAAAAPSRLRRPGCALLLLLLLAVIKSVVRIVGGSIGAARRRRRCKGCRGQRGQRRGWFERVAASRFGGRVEGGAAQPRGGGRPKRADPKKTAAAAAAAAVAVKQPRGGGGARRVDAPANVGRRRLRRLRRR